MKLHAFCELFPPMAPEEFARLVVSMQARGFDPLYPIITYQGAILDGANRWRAAEKLGLTPTCQGYAGTDPLAFVISANLDRRHLDENQRAMVAAKLATMRQGTRTDKEPRVNSREVSKAEAAKLLHVGTSAVEAARAVQEQAAPELVRAVEQGRVAVSAARTLARLSREEQVAVASEGDEAARRSLIKTGKRNAAALPAPATPPEAAPANVAAHPGCPCPP